jgi:phosphatidylglycerophosphate synthase
MENSTSLGRAKELDPKTLLWIVPTALTVSRFAMLFFIMISISYGQKMLALAIYAVAEATDILDGALARRLRVASELGALLDTLSDKLFHLPFFFYFLIWPRPNLPHLFLFRELLMRYGGHLMFAVIFTIELLLILSRTPLLDRWRVVASNKAGFFGKIKTWIQAIAIGGYIYGVALSVTLGQVLVAVAVVFGLLSLSSRVRFVR